LRNIQLKWESERCAHVAAWQCNPAAARAVLDRFDPRQAGVSKTSQCGPRLTGIIDESL